MPALRTARQAPPSTGAILRRAPKDVTSTPCSTTEQRLSPISRRRGDPAATLFSSARCRRNGAEGDGKHRSLRSMQCRLGAAGRRQRGDLGVRRRRQYGEGRRGRTLPHSWMPYAADGVVVAGQIFTRNLLIAGAGSGLGSQVGHPATSASPPAPGWHGAAGWRNTVSMRRGRILRPSPPRRHRMRPGAMPNVVAGIGTDGGLRS